MPYAATEPAVRRRPPEIPPGDANEIMIMRQMLEKLPFGSSPVVQVLEYVAASPGVLADPNVRAVMDAFPGAELERFEKRG